MRLTTAMLIGAAAGVAGQHKPIRDHVRRVTHVALGRPLMYRIHVEEGGVLVEKPRTLIDSSTLTGLGPNKAQREATEQIIRALDVLNSRPAAVTFRNTKHAALRDSALLSSVSDWAGGA